MKYYFECTHNQSMEQKFLTEEFEWKEDELGYIEANSFSEFLQKFKAKFADRISEINHCEVDEDSDNGTIWASNSVDGLELRFKVISAIV